jgi:hypothetical protein
MRVNAPAMSCAQGQDGGIFKCRRRWPLTTGPAMCRICSLTCPMFVTTAEFLPQHHAQRQATQIITAAETPGHDRVAEMNRQVAGNLDKIIATLQDERPDEREAAAGVS